MTRVTGPISQYAPRWALAGRPLTSDCVEAAQRRRAGETLTMAQALPLFHADMWSRWDGQCMDALTEQAIELEARAARVRIVRPDSLILHVDDMERRILEGDGLIVDPRGILS